jgi:hypothetical protein
MKKQKKAPYSERLKEMSVEDLYKERYQAASSRMYIQRDLEDALRHEKTIAAEIERRGLPEWPDAES